MKHKAVLPAPATVSSDALSVLIGILFFFYCGFLVKTYADSASIEVFWHVLNVSSHFVCDEHSCRKNAGRDAPETAQPVTNVVDSLLRIGHRFMVARSALHGGAQPQSPWHHCGAQVSSPQAGPDCTHVAPLAGVGSG